MGKYVVQTAELWREQRDDLMRRVAELHEKERDLRVQQPGELSWDIVDAIGALIRGQYDPEYGGFGREPKFPQPRLLRFVLDEQRRTGDPALAGMLHRTLSAMAGGGMYDAVEGGFFRYATTRHWAVPHFEKMLEDNSELLAVYAEAHRTFPSAGYDRVVRDAIRWMDAVLWRAEVAAFAGSQDADEHYYELDAGERSKHEPPFVDPTLYTSWNALAATAYFAAYAALGDRAIEDRAHQVMHTLATRMWDPVAKTLFHFDRGDGPRLPGLLSDLAANLQATLDAYETGLHPGALMGAERAARTLREQLEDADLGGFWDAPQRDETARLASREKPIEDGALAADGLLRLAALTGDESWRESAVRALRGFVGEYRRWGQFAAGYGSAVARALAPALVIVVVGPGADPRADALWRVALGSDDPASSRHRLVPGRDDQQLASGGYPADRLAAYVCVGTTCSAPLEDEPALVSELARVRGRFRRD
jgi:uncharacterized protein YyaL (SSP411 family)